ncbi:hypothetical protein [Synechococcus sp. PCC 7336]|uniref:hypothetical protein n=1 Tax=Synechococcus sp. PCC 7336 TaxID=195250 RepID=UPI00034882EE|nr:hypothetical protein [Synechococcus sp. PCC 7336]
MDEDKLAKQVASAAHSVEALTNQVTGYMQRTEVMLGQMNATNAQIVSNNAQLGAAIAQLSTVVMSNAESTRQWREETDLRLRALEDIANDVGGVLKRLEQRVD